MKDLFLSYRSTDVKLATWLRERLREQQFSVWFDVEQIGHSSEVAYRLSEGLSESLGLIALVTSAYVDSEWTEKELSAALQLYRLASDRFPGMRKSVILAVAEDSVVLPGIVSMLIEVGRLAERESYLGETQSGLRQGMRRLTVSSICDACRRVGGIAKTENVIAFPLYRDELENTIPHLRAALSAWKEARVPWVDLVGTSVPTCDSDRGSHQRRIWEWIPALGRYGDEAFKSAAQYLDDFRVVHAGAVQSESNGDDLFAKAAQHLWDNRSVSLVLDEQSLGALWSFAASYGPSRVTSQPHFGNPTDVVIGITKSEKSGIVQLEAAYRHLRTGNTEINDLFDLSMLAAFIVACERWFCALPEFQDVERHILKPLVNDTLLLAEFY